MELTVEISVDSSAAKSVASRSGLGNIRHLETKRLWIQEAVWCGRLVITKIRGDSRPADVLTKPLSHAEMTAKLTEFGAISVRRQSV